MEAKKVDFFVLQSKIVWDYFWQTHFWQNNESINFNDSKLTFAFKNAQFQSETYIESAAQNLHFMIDILCQIINKAVINSRIDEAKVSIGKTIQELNKEKNTQDIVNALEDLRDAHQFKYIAAFVNTIKHRSLLDTDYYAEFGQGKSNTIGVRFLSFKYEKPGKPTENYDNTFAETIVNDYIECIFNLIDGVGRATDTYIRHEIN